MTSLRSRVTIIYSLLLLVALGSLALLVRAQMVQEYRDVLRNRLIAEARLVALEAGARLEAGLPMQEWATQAGSAGGTRITLILSDGRVVADSHDDPARMENHASRAEVVEVLRRGSPYGEAQRRSATVGEDFYYVAVPLPGAPPPGVARVAVAVSSIEAGLQGLSLTLLSTVLLVAVLTLLASYLFSRITLRPLTQMAAVAARLGKGDLQARLRAEPGAGDEMAQLASAFNDMAARLASAMGRLIVQRDDMNAVLQQMSEGLVMTDEDGRVLLMNRVAATMLDTDEAASVGKPFIQVVRDHEISGALREIITSPSALTATHEMSYGPRRLQVALAAVPHAGRRNGVAVMHDVTELRRLERARRDFVANISHELRTPLASIKLLVETLESAVEDDPAEAREFLKRIDVELDGLTQLVRELLELSRVESGQVELRLSSVEPDELVRAAVKRLTPLAERSGLSVEVEVESDLPPCAADRDRVEQVLLNLLHNAIKYTPPGGRIKVSASSEEEGRVIRFAVADTGVGIPPEDVPRLFERFYKVDKARTTIRSTQSEPVQEGGTGLGLAIAKHLVQAHGGTIWATSTVGGGSTFYFTLPVAHARVPVAQG